MKRFWQFGGWFSVEPVDERKKGWGRRARIHLRRIAADGVKLLLILVAVYFASMPFWPLAVPPVPAELRAKYPIPEYKPRGNGEAARMMQAMYPEAPLVYTNGTFEASLPPELTNAPLYRLSELLKTYPDGGTNRPRPELDELLAIVEPQLHAYAERCAAEEAPATPLSDHPFGDVIPSSRHAIVTVCGFLSDYYIAAGDRDGALRALQSLARIGAYYLRSDELVARLTGMHMVNMFVGNVVGLQAHGLLAEVSAASLGQQLDTLMASRGSMVAVMARDKENHILREASTWAGKWDGLKLSHDEDANRSFKLVRRWGWTFGNSRSSLEAAYFNLDDRQLLEAQIWADPGETDPARKTELLWEYVPDGWWALFRRGWLATTLMPVFSPYYRKEYGIEGQLLIGKSLAAIGAYEQKHGTLPESLDVALAGLRPDYKLEGIYVRNKPEYRRLDDGSQTNAYAYTVTVWGDGGRCPKEGGVSWLVCRNPAFGETPYRCWRWQMYNSSAKYGVKKNEIIWTKDPIPAPRGEGEVQEVLFVSAALAGDSPEQIAAAALAMCRAGWVEQAIPPRVSLSSK